MVEPPNSETRSLLQVTDPLAQIVVSPREDQSTAMGSGETPSVVAPRNCGQSVPWTIESPRSNRPKAPASTRDSRIGNRQIVSAGVWPVKVIQVRCAPCMCCSHEDVRPYAIKVGRAVPCAPYLFLH